ncbi:5-oxoprolinase subunit PxpA [Sulfurovum sp.]|uniref:5-oxoprolinase subunit PxpA n=1 Tax=Sulfurovum sp. TaxID=1969726 RepID=UPI002867FFA1|nr:5-oxoprolinase subunit PxpA [Sulfurovum sp.]
MKAKRIKLNCDMGEALDISLDEQIMPYIDMANLACAFHAGDPVIMHKSIKNAKANAVDIGAHPSYPDLEGFGRREMQCSTEEIVSFIIYQCGALDALCQSYGVKMSYIKPHGALYNTMMKDLEVFKAIAKAVSKYDKNIKLMILSNVQNEKFASIAGKYDVSLLYEVFADRAYQDDGNLVPRSEEGAVLNSVEEVLQRAKLLHNEGIIESINGKKLSLHADTLCVHGDNAHALTLIQALYQL